MSTAADQNPRQQSLRRLGGLAHQTRASLRAADRFVTQGVGEDRDNASWLVCTAVELAREVADDLDGLAKGLREAGNDAARQQALAPWRKVAHQLHAACRAADVYLEQDARDDRDTGTWLVASALALADRLAGALDDGVGAWAAAAAEPAKRIAPVGAPRAAAG
jgi:hypothetical protein